MATEQHATTHLAQPHPFGERVRAALEEFLARQAERLRGIDAQLDPQIEAVTALVSGGKRMRPAFCYWGWRGAGGADCTEIVTAAAALELLHASALAHDDVIDASDTRRGQPTAHRRFATHHVAHGWHGSAAQFGAGGAILLGDLCLAWSDEMLRTCGLSPERLWPALGYFDTMRTEVIAGQHLDLTGQARATSSVTDAMRVVRYKAAKYTVERPLHLGGALAGMGPALMRAYSSYGLPIGEAFQLRDDILGVFGDPTVTGKPAADDLRAGKRTVLVAKTLTLATPPQASRFQQLFGSATLDAVGVDELREIITSSGAVREVERLIDRLSHTALTTLTEAPLHDDGASAALTELAQSATQRVR